MARRICDVLNLQKPVRRWEDMNPDCLATIFEKAGTASLMLDIPFVCKSWYSASLNPKCWKTLDLASVIDEKAYYSLFDKVNNIYFVEFVGLRRRFVPNLEMVKFAVRRSQGMATKVVVGYWIPAQKKCFEDTLHCISNGCPGLRSLILPQMELPKSISGLMKNWKDLEHLKMNNDIYFKDVLTEIYTHCEKFVALTTGTYIDSEQVSAIVTLLPKIKYLALPASELSRENLVIILSRCRELEALDVRGCVGFDGDDTELLNMASHIRTFMCEGSTIDYADDMYGFSVCYDEIYFLR